MSDSSTGRSSAKLVRKNALWNILGQGLPMAVAVLCIPRLIAGIGIERFGALTIVWTFLNYFGLFDFGIGRALTQLLAGRPHEDKREEAGLIWTVLILLFVLGAVAGLILCLSAPMFSSKLLKLQGPLTGEMLWALIFLGFTLPFLLQSVALKGVLEARRRFDLLNYIRIPLGFFIYGAPLVVMLFSRNLGTIVAVLLIGRIAAYSVNFWMVFRIAPHLKGFGWRPRRILELMRFGGWFTVTSVVGPIIDNMDRFFINAMLSISMVAYFTTPFEAVSKLLILPASITGVLFPEFATRFHRSPGETQTLFIRGIKYLLMLLFPAMLLITAYAHEGLALWLTPAFADLSGPVLQWLAIYLLLAGVTQVPFAFLLGIGKPRIPATLHLLELLIYAGILYLLLKMDGIRGAAIAATLRIAMDFLGQLFFCGKLLRFNGLTYGKILLPLGAMISVLLGFHAGIPPLFKAFLVMGVLLTHVYVCWNFILEGPDKRTAMRLLGRPG